MFDKILFYVRGMVPLKIWRVVRPHYHLMLAFFSALFYFFPSRKIFIVGVTGTKGKTSVVEILGNILEEAGYTVALSNTFRFKIGDTIRPNEFKMTMPGRFFLQRFLRKAVQKKCDYAIIEMTSEGAAQSRHRFISLNALIFTNLAPEHIESHGSYEKYLNAKLQLARALEKSSKKEKVVVANDDDKEGRKFLDIRVPHKYAYTIKDAEPYELKKEGLQFSWEDISISSRLSGTFNLYNILAAAFFAKSQGVEKQVIKRALLKFSGIPGRMEKIDEGQDFTVIVDYAHTPDSLQKVYEVFQNSQKICVLGGTGGGRDHWKRKEMGRIAGNNCSRIILTNEDPYDEDPRHIVEEIRVGIEGHTHTIIMDRREAIREALRGARTGDAVLVTGKGTDPYIMGPKNSKVPWNDAFVTREELRNTLKKN